ncbi:MAG: glycosyltransferase family 2 protein [Geminicoccaceae bacterium]
MRGDEGVVRLAHRLGRETRADEAELVLRRSSGSAPARELARLLQAQRRYGEAEQQWRAAVADHPDDPAVWQGHARVLRLLHRLKDAAAALEVGRQRFPAVRTVALEAARLAMQRESHAEAAAHYHRALALPGAAAEALDELAKVLAAQHRFAAARSLLDRLAAAEPAKHSRREGLARLAEDEGDLELAQKVWEEVLELEPTNLRAKLARGRLLEAFGRMVEAERLYRDLCERHPASHEPLYQLGRLALVQASPEVALAWLERAQALDPLDWAVRAATVRATAEQHRFATARRLAAAQVERLPDFLDAHLLCAWVEERAGRDVAADRRLTATAAAFPQAWLPALRHAELHLRNGRASSARLHLERSLLDHPATFSLRLTLADACFADSDAQSAARNLAALADDYPLHREVAKRLARLEVAAGRHATARALWADVTRLDRRVAGPPVHLERLDDRPLPPAAGEIRLFTRLRNEALRLPWFLDFYRAQGVTRFIVVDNGSDDGSRELLLAQPDVHLYLTTDSYAVYGGGMRWLNDLLERHGCDAWCLTVDVDELLAYPHAERLDLRGLTAHLDRQGVEALQGFMLDLYGEDSLQRLAYAPGDDPLRTCRCFDRSGYVERDDPDFPFRTVTGGLVARYFYAGLQDGVYLHKVPLVRWRSGLRYTSSTHTLLPVPLAEESCVLLHLKYMADFVDRARIEAERKQYWQGAKRYAVFNRSLGGGSEGDFRCELTERLTSTRQLVDLGLLRSSPALDALAAHLTTEALAGWRGLA